MFCSSDERFSAGEEHMENMKPHHHTATHVATSDFQTEFLSRSRLTGTYLRKQAVARLLYSHVSMLLSMLHQHVIYAIAFSAGLSGLQGD